MQSPGSSLALPAARSLPILTGSRRCDDPEEEVFSLSLETEQSQDWPYMDTTTSSSCLEEENSAGLYNFSRLISPLKAL